MTLEKKIKGGTLFIKVAGRIDSNTASQLQNEIDASVDEAERAEIDASELTYISSAGLRVLLGLRKKFKENSDLVLIGLTENVRTVLEMTGFDGIMTIR